MAINGRNKRGTTTIRANIDTKTVLPSALFARCEEAGRLSSSRPLRWKILRRLLVNEPLRLLQAPEGDVSGFTGGRWKYAPSTTRVMGIEQLPACVMAP